MQKRVFINGQSAAPRHTVVRDVERAVSDCGGWILGHQQFSNISIALSVEIPENRLPELVRRVELAGVVLSKASRALAGDDSSAPDTLVASSVQITFFHNEPDLRIDVPSVPG